MYNQHNLCKKEPKMRFSAIFLSLRPRIDPILHIKLVKNICQHLAMVRGNAWLIKSMHNQHDLCKRMCQFFAYCTYLCYDYFNDSGCFWPFSFFHFHFHQSKVLKAVCLFFKNRKQGGYSKLKCLVKIRKSGNYPPPLQL